MFIGRIRHNCLWAMFISVLMLSGSTPARALPDIPPSSIKVPPMVPEESISTFVPSASAPGNGISVNLVYPGKPRYPEGAPVVVVVPSGEVSDGQDFSIHASQSGFVEVRLAFPGGGRLRSKSSGTYDGRGPSCQEALKDVLLFATGRIKDTQGRSIQNLLPVKVDRESVGLVGWSNGGNLALVTLSRFADKLGFVGWVAFYESPIGELFYPPNLGGVTDLVLNEHYRQGSAATGHCLVDYRKLCWQPSGEKSPGAHKRLGEPEIPGVLFFDENHNQRWDEAFEFAFSYVTTPAVNKQIYPPQVTLALERLGLFKKQWPDAVADLSQSEAYFMQHDGSLFIADIARRYPRLMATVFGCRLDHLQRQPDHPHITLLYNSWLANRLYFVRLNPDPRWVAQVADMNSFNFVNNPPNTSIDATDVDSYLEPNGLVPDYVFMEAAIAELSDRKRAALRVKPSGGSLGDSRKGSNGSPMVDYSNGAKQ